MRRGGGAYSTECRRVCEFEALVLALMSITKPHDERVCVCMRLDVTVNLCILYIVYYLCHTWPIATDILKITKIKTEHIAEN